MALVYDNVDRGVGVTKGSGSHLDPEIAILRAITEALQARLNFIAGSRDDIFRSAFVRFRADWRRAVDALKDSHIECQQAVRFESTASDTFEDDIHELLKCIQSVGLCHAVVVDLTPQDFPVHVVRVLVPGLEGYMHTGYQPGRRAVNYAENKDET
jgi:ribosomal protein S12 methylthiotransferase accessory factor